MAAPGSVCAPLRGETLQPTTKGTAMVLAGMPLYVKLHVTFDAADGRSASKLVTLTLGGDTSLPRHGGVSDLRERGIARTICPWQI
jgi:hypothetical protein